MLQASVILPVYNAELYVGAAVKSILKQSTSDFELIVVDDGSTDDSGEIVVELAEADRRIRFERQENRGIIETLNRAASIACSPLLFRMDADDIAEPDRFEMQLKYLDENRDCVALGTSVMLIDPEGRPLRPMRMPEQHEDIDAANICGGRGHGVFHPTVAIRREAFEKVGGYLKQYPHAEDIDLFLRLAEVGRLANLPDIGLRYRVHPASIGYTRRREQLASARQAACDACERRGLPKPEWPAESEEGSEEWQTYRRWGWWALQGQNVKTARYYAMRAVRSRPLDPGAWRLLACAARGH